MLGRRRVGGRRGGPVGGQKRPLPFGLPPGDQLTRQELEQPLLSFDLADVDEELTAAVNGSMHWDSPDLKVEGDTAVVARLR